MAGVWRASFQSGGEAARAPPTSGRLGTSGPARAKPQYEPFPLRRLTWGAPGVVPRLRGFCWYRAPQDTNRAGRALPGMNSPTTRRARVATGPKGGGSAGRALPLHLPPLPSPHLSRPSLPAPVFPALPLPRRGRGRRLPRASAPPRPHKGPSPWQPRGPERSAVRGPGAIEPRRRTSRYGTWGQGQRGSDARGLRLCGSRRLSLVCRALARGSGAVLLCGGRRGPAPLSMSVRPSGKARRSPPHTPRVAPER
jgi:hypothetical protein